MIWPPALDVDAGLFFKIWHMVVIAEMQNAQWSTKHEIAELFHDIRLHSSYSEQKETVSRSFSNDKKKECLG